MLAPITIRYDFRPKRRSLATAAVANLFGLPEGEPPHIVCAKNSRSIFAPATSCCSSGRAAAVSRRCCARSRHNWARSMRSRCRCRTRR